MIRPEAEKRLAARLTQLYDEPPDVGLLLGGAGHGGAPTAGAHPRRGGDHGTHPRQPSALSSDTTSYRKPTWLREESPLLASWWAVVSAAVLGGRAPYAEYGAGPQQEARGELERRIH